MTTAMTLAQNGKQLDSTIDSGYFDSVIHNEPGGGGRMIEEGNSVVDIEFRFQKGTAISQGSSIDRMFTRTAQLRCN